MATRYYANSTTGIYLGGYDETLDAPADSVETGVAPAYSTQIWNGTAWTGAYQGDLSDDVDAVAFQFLYNGAPPELVALIPLLRLYGNVPASRMGMWANIKAYAPAWLTQTWITNTEAYCAANHMNLVP